MKQIEDKKQKSYLTKCYSEPLILHITPQNHYWTNPKKNIRNEDFLTWKFTQEHKSHAKNEIKYKLFIIYKKKQNLALVIN